MGYTHGAHHFSQNVFCLLHLLGSSLLDFHCGAVFTFPSPRVGAFLSNLSAVHQTGHVVANAVHCLHNRHLHAESHSWGYAWERTLALILRSCSFCPRVVFATCLLKCPIEFKKLLRLKLLYEQRRCRCNLLPQLQALDALLVKRPYNARKTTRTELMDPCPCFL